LPNTSSNSSPETCRGSVSLSPASFASHCLFFCDTILEKELSGEKNIGDDLEDKGIVRKIKKGRGNIILMNK